MKLLFDQNLSPKLATRLADLYPGSEHVWNLGLEEATDSEIWEKAKDDGFTVVTKDSDFHELVMSRGFPPKAVWLRRGNCSTNDIETILRQDLKAVRALAEDGTTGLLILY